MNYLKKFEKTILIFLVFMMSIVVALSTIELGWILYKDITTPPLLLLEIEELLELFGVFLLVLIGIELLETIKTYFIERVIHGEVVLEVAMIAIARKVIILDVKELSSVTLLGIASIIIALAVGYWLVKHGFKENKSTN